jgi:large subunit ribosomal protein L22
MQAIARVKYLKVAPKKMRLVAELVKGKPVEEALNILNYTPKVAAHHLAKTVKSAAANAMSSVGTGKLKAEDLAITKIMVDSAPTAKRVRFQSMGRVFRIRKRYCHLLVEVEGEPEPETTRGKARRRKKAKAEDTAEPEKKTGTKGKAKGKAKTKAAKETAPAAADVDTKAEAMVEEEPVAETAEETIEEPIEDKVEDVNEEAGTEKDAADEKEDK